ncbi:Haloacid dehalogenase domain protein hydrolase [Cellulomonas flavigena DSM 20109]|uniref:Haloacid dehalogenase domain protein hydrolase n=1 Tax=Cellulomonas flavigena (strain ATCC 482 / DSM 20109 / BCRC 11376 / JCM 18109 / NBRC 3775 / NCIMB 8073 / NRS 134) TaxID=446466 RepID=D5UD14_CELFN|nr:HAD hydrolase-like protein [Cellulomonas flavigena]ADG74351.1 Haloacid dehalogenase domain protein hydrolase [Cellulomonas flavigena DSM 20109]
MPPLPTRPVALLDLDGTLMDSAPGIVASVSAAYAHVGLPAPTDAVMRSFAGPPIQWSFTTHGVGAEQLDAAVAAYGAHFSGAGVWDTRVFDGVPAALATLREAGVLLVVATAKPLRWAAPICDEVGLTPLLDHVVGAPDDESESKGDIIGRALAWVHSAVDGADVRAVMLGDREHDVHGAAEHGLPCLGALWGYGGADELRAAGAVELLDSPADVPAAVLAHVGPVAR